MNIATTNRNPGIVPPWLTAEPKNPGIVPPWLELPVHILPVDVSAPVATAGGETQFVRESTALSPNTLVDALRAHR